MKMQQTITLILAIATSAISLRADVKPAALFQDNMVIQRDIQATIWGKADPGESVEVSASWSQKSATTSADQDGNWEVVLETPKAGGPHTITFKGNNTVTINDVVSGDVWLCSGQSNMVYQVSAVVSKGGFTEGKLGSFDYPNVRQFKVERNASKTLLDECKGVWVKAGVETVGSFSGAAFFFGRSVNEQLDVPVGLINASWGGTPIESWISLDKQSDHAPTQKDIAKKDKVAANYDGEKLLAEYKVKLAEWENSTGTKKELKATRPRLPTSPYSGQRFPGNLYGGMINPLIRFNIKGALWYQGEANAGPASAAIFYETQLQALVEDWRERFGQDDLPFFFVQLPNCKSRQVDPVQDGMWAIIRESVYKATLTIPNTAMAITIDIGKATSRHPPNKIDLGDRLARLALNKVYGEDVVASGPVYNDYVIGEKNRNQVIIRFKYSESGLSAKDGGKIKGVAIAGEDNEFKWANAVVNEEKPGEIIVSHPDIPKPKSVRYAWADNPHEANLVNGEGLPAAPFRTDNLPLYESKPSKKRH